MSHLAPPRLLPPPWLRMLLGYPVLLWKKPALSRFLSALSDPAPLQAERLLRHLAQIDGSVMGKKLGLNGVRTVGELKRAIPIAGFDRCAEFVARAMDGDKSALFARDVEVFMFAETSGTTAAAKHIPVTRTSLDEYRASWTIWGLGIARHHPWIPFHGVLNIVSAYDARPTKLGVPVGNITGLLYHSMRRLLGVTNVAPLSLSSIKDADQRYYATLRLALARDDLMMMTTANPSTLIVYARKMDEWKERLLADIAPHVSRGRISALEKVIRSTGHLYPKDAWPKLALLGVWTGGTLMPFLEALPRYYGDVPRRDHGLSASEGRMTLPLEDQTPYGPLNIGAAFYEFVPESDYGSENPPTLLAHELEKSGRYYLVVTTSGGLMRYDLADLVECGGFIGKTPLIRFLNKSSQFANITGEKLSAHQVSAAISRTLSSLGITSNELGEVSLAPTKGDPPGYALLIEAGKVPAALEAEALVRRLDEELASANIEYADKRKSQRLGTVRLLFVKEGAFERLRRERLDKRGGSLEQYKHPILIADPESVQ